MQNVKRDSERKAKQEFTSLARSSGRSQTSTKRKKPATISTTSTRKVQQYADSFDEDDYSFGDDYRQSGDTNTVHNVGYTENNVDIGFDYASRFDMLLKDNLGKGNSGIGSSDNDINGFGDEIFRGEEDGNGRGNAQLPVSKFKYQLSYNQGKPELTSDLANEVYNPRSDAQYDLYDDDEDEEEQDSGSDWRTRVANVLGEDMDVGTRYQRSTGQNGRGYKTYRDEDDNGQDEDGDEGLSEWQRLRQTQQTEPKKVSSREVSAAMEALTRRQRHISDQLLEINSQGEIVQARKSPLTSKKRKDWKSAEKKAGGKRASGSGSMPGNMEQRHLELERKRKERRRKQLEDTKRKDKMKKAELEEKKALELKQERKKHDQKRLQEIELEKEQMKRDIEKIKQDIEQEAKRQAEEEMKMMEEMERLAELKREQEKVKEQQQHEKQRLVEQKRLLDEAMEIWQDRQRASNLKEMRHSFVLWQQFVQFRRLELAKVDSMVRFKRLNVIFSAWRRFVRMVQGERAVREMEERLM
eukprot:TRINITY_DN3469_c0_g1_i1.p1 TRINITY_DN3469_c0_g1~~TRINITY_DN3469_c0_g1_i1.p1  ORF type:complete len:526 (+),score=166.37 TRINITY_DN3469_c0_g1_i1:2-1579(+)